MTNCLHTRNFYSTETLSLKVHGSIMTSLDKGEVVMLVMLVMLDLSAAFDTIDYDILLRSRNMALETQP